MYQLLIIVSFALLGSFSPGRAQAHGNVTLDDDLCVIQIGYFRAHFKIYLPRVSQHRDYCEDIPWGREAVFVMEYMHGELGDVPVDFRIVRDVTGMGRFAKLEDVQRIEDLDSVTVFYQSPRRSPDVFTVLHEFDERGEYLGIVTARHPETDQLYTAIFPFEVGYTRLGYVPVFIILAIIVQGLFWYSGRRRRSAGGDPS